MLSPDPTSAGKQRRSSQLAFLLTLLISFLLLTPAAKAQPGAVVPVQNPEWEILITPFGYSDLLFDRRPGFEGREYLSGEWAAAVGYDLDGETVMPVWFEPDWIAPDWETNSDFGVVPGGPANQPIYFANPTDPNNADGFPVYQSVITNAHLRITMTYEMIDTVDGMEMGLEPAVTGADPGASVTSTRYAFRHTYTIENISGLPITNLRLFQFLHGLESAVATYDDRAYGGVFADHRFDITEQGSSYGVDFRNGGIAQHHDVIGFHSSQMPSAFEVGYYGRFPDDDHQTAPDLEGPSVGVHKSVQADALDGTDRFAPPETRWVGGAQRYDLGALADGESTGTHVLLTLQTETRIVVGASMRDVQVGSITLLPGGRLRIDFTDDFQTEEPVRFGYSIHINDKLAPFNPGEVGLDSWTQLPVPYTILSPTEKRFEFDLPDGGPWFFLIGAAPDNTPVLTP